MIEMFFIIVCLFIFSSIFLAIVMYAVIAVFYILKFSFPLFLRLILFVFFGLSVIKPDNRKSFDGTYVVKYLKWNDGDGKVYSTDDKGVKPKKMYYGFKGEEFFSSFEIELPDSEPINECLRGRMVESGKAVCRVEGWFTLFCSGSSTYPNGNILDFEIRIQKISNRIVEEFFKSEAS